MENHPFLTHILCSNENLQRISQFYKFYDVEFFDSKMMDL